MALQDLTPQLRTRLSRMEKAVGWFVFLATALLVFGFAYYIYTLAQRKGWFLTKAPFFTFTDRATGLKVGDPVKLMGLDVGQITLIDPMPPGAPYNMYVEFEIKKPYYGYMWTDGSRAKITTADLLGKRTLEVTKGTGGWPIYLFNPLRDVSLSQVDSLPEPERWKLAEDVYDTTGIGIAVEAFAPLTKENLATLAALGRTEIRVLDTREEKKLMTAVWVDSEARYKPFARDTKPYWLRSDESPAVTERMEKLVGQVEKALPDFLSLTNQLQTALGNAAELTANLNTTAASARPIVSNLAVITAQLHGPGSLGEWLIPTNLNVQLTGTLAAAQATLDTARGTLTTAETNLTLLATELAASLEHLASITSNLNAQVQANTNILSTISDAVVHADELVQGLKRHWLLRSAFRDRSGEQTNQPPARLRSPKDTSLSR